MDKVSETASQQKQKRRKKRSKQAATSSKLEGNTKPLSQNGATQTNRHSSNPISKEDSHSVKKSDIANNNIQTAIVHKRYLNKSSIVLIMSRRPPSGTSHHAIT